MNLSEILSDLSEHKKWVVDTKEGKRADFRRADLHGADLHGANLSGANLSGADLSGADLHDANLIRANLSGANLRWADLRGANLSNANLRWADLTRANLRWANLRWADLHGANLRGAKGIIYFGFDLRGYVLICWLKAGEKWFNAGCISFPMDKALTHWSSTEYEDPERGQLYITAIMALSKIADEVLK